LARKSNTSTTQIDKSSYFFTFQCGICHPGGGPTQYDRDGRLYWDGTQFGYGGGVTVLPTAARLDGDYGFVVPRDGPGGVPAAGTPTLANGWRKNGVLEADCLLCHLQGYNWRNRAATLTAQGVANNTAGAPLAAFKMAPVVGAGWGTVTIAAAPPFPPTGTAVGPVDYELGISAGTLVPNAANELTLALGKVGPTPETNCRGCHSTPDTKKSGRTLNDTNDVHRAGGVGCTACHPLAGANRLEHQIGKGDVTIGSVRDDLDRTVRSCASCHLDGASPLAPDPTVAHRSIPSLHFAAMACQACHIRFLEDDLGAAGIQAPEIVIEMTSTGTQTASTWDRYFRGDAFDPSQPDAALAAAGGTAYRWYPAIRSWRGQLTTVKPLITAYYGDWISGTGDAAVIRPIPLRFVRKALTGVYGQGAPRLASFPLTAGGNDPANPIPFTKADIRAQLVAMRDAVDTANPDPAANNDVVVNPVLVRAEKIYYLNEAGEVEWFHSAVAESHDFAINHNVVAKRDPANPVLRPGPYGAGGCTDCHSATSTFFFAKQLVEPAQYEFADELGTVPNPDAGHPEYVEHWEAMGFSAYRVAALTGNRVAVSLRIGGWGPGSRVVGGGIDCGLASGVCATTVADGGSLVLTASPGVGAAVRSWRGCTPSADLLTCAVDAQEIGALGGAHVVFVEFGIPDPTPAPTTSGIQLTVVGTGWGTVTGAGLNCNLGTQGACNAEVADGTAVTLTATPGPNSWLVGWTGCTPVAGTQTCTATVAGITDVQAQFSNGSGGGEYSLTQRLTAVPYGLRPGNRIFGAPIDCTSASSSGTCAADIATDGTVILQAQAGSGSTFVRWEGCTSVTNGVCSVTLDVPRVVFAVFSP
jgi:Cytochrome c554 and c-prime/Divergent InlB B-repeat domain